jgi:hypothetical protein
VLGSNDNTGGCPQGRQPSSDPQNRQWTDAGEVHFLAQQKQKSFRYRAGFRDPASSGWSGRSATGNRKKPSVTK